MLDYDRCAPVEVPGSIWGHNFGPNEMSAGSNVPQTPVSFERRPTGSAPVARAPASSWDGTFFLSERIGSRGKGAVSSLVFFCFFLGFVTDQTLEMYMPFSVSFVGEKRERGFPLSRPAVTSFTRWLGEHLPFTGC